MLKRHNGYVDVLRNLDDNQTGSKQDRAKDLPAKD